MATMQLNLRDDLQQRLTARAAESGYKSANEYVEALIRADFGDDESDDDIEEILLARLDSGPSIEVTPEYRKQLIEELSQPRKREH
jgi:antitoxin ParD1/3/4